MRANPVCLFLFLCLFARVDVFAGTSVIINKTVILYDDTVTMRFVHDESFFNSGWDTVAQTRFWKQIINLPSDTCIVNIAECRKPVGQIAAKHWSRQSEQEKLCYKDSVCSVNSLAQGTSLFITTGKEEFYQVRKTLSIIDQSIGVFESKGCDPWFAQAILLIESPGKLKAKSVAGAVGPFQLMPYVARKYGLIVNKQLDERTDVTRSAQAAASLLTTSCIPAIHGFLQRKGIKYSTDDIWFKLLVLHVYHAGAGNVACVMDSITEFTTGMDLMRKVWKTSCAGFQNEAQNYSQVALGSLLNFEELIAEDGDTVYLITGDKLMHEFRTFRKDMQPVEAYEYMTQTLGAYEYDFLDEVMTFDQFISRISDVRSAFISIAEGVGFNDGDIRFKKYPSDEEHLTRLGEELAKRRRFDDAILLLKLDMELHPESAIVADSLSRVYRLSGNKEMAEQYSRKSAELSMGR